MFLASERTDWAPAAHATRSESMPPAPRDAGPVIGGSLAISAAPPAPPPPIVKGPGAGNASGLVLMLVVAVGVVVGAAGVEGVELRPLDAKLGFEEHRVPLKVPAAAKGNSDHAVLASLRSGGELA